MRIVAISCLCLASNLFGADPVRVQGLVLPFQEVTLSSAVSGLVDTVEIEEGDHVEAGQILAQLADAEARLEVERSAQVVELKRFDAQGTEKLYEQNMARQDEALEKAVELRIAELQSDLAETALERRRIRAPFAGVIVSRDKEPGEWSEPGAEFFQLVDFQQVYLQLLLPHAQTVALEIGQSIEVQSDEDAAGAEARGEVAFIDPRVDAASGFQRVKILIPNEDGQILPGVRLWAILPAD
ncbi:efflux RND transporter periplasmic adaptor subunit [Pelagicoccus albus]|uniref:Efflux RND transporter periplasmic adaptor subunit n=1 Tax=Pelagicoccus albus TaxID=415222 RepID=A0A7X1E9C4_9BACT|nr:efflux RND transporter periplasmic adaptor subunit [Pelagicoccus albus]MBC2607279.1 efflux RND transporter periplasmic adaptor subunit [Pelagicoccus albus]